MHGAGKVRSFEFNKTQNEGYSCTIVGDDKLMALVPERLLQLRRKNVTGHFIDLKNFLLLHKIAHWAGWGLQFLGFVLLLPVDYSNAYQMFMFWI